MKAGGLEVPPDVAAKVAALPWGARLRFRLLAWVARGVLAAGGTSKDIEEAAKRVNGKQQQKGA